MAHFAEIDANNIVIRVIVVDNSVAIDEATGAAFCASLLGGTWKQTSYNGNFRKRFAGVGFKYDAKLDAFIPPKPFQSWVFDKIALDWRAPVPPPPDGGIWNEEKKQWDAFSPLV